MGNNGNNSYQFYFQAKFGKDLPKNISINIDGNKYDFNNPDKFGNNLIERFTIINIPEQDVSNLFKLQNIKIPEKYSEKKKNNWKYLITIDENKEKNCKIFLIKKQDCMKKYYKIKEDEFKKIKKIFNENINQIENKDMKEVLYQFLRSKTKEEILNILNIFNQGFIEYKFKNKRHDYETVKYLSFIELCLKSIFLNNEANIFAYFNNFKIILNSIINLEYLDRIKVLLGFVLNFNNNITEGEIQNLIFDRIYLFDLDNKESCVNYPYIKVAYDVLYKIIDKIEEECPLYQGMAKLNSFIYEEIINNDIFHSGSLLNIDDIKLELIKNMNRFLFLSFKENSNIDDHSEYFVESKTTIIFLLSIFKNKEDIYNKKYFNNAASAILILLIHENFGHEKKSINNEKISSPRNHNDNNFKDFSLNEGDSGDVLEYFLIKDTFDIEHLMMNKEPEKLLNHALYIDNLKSLRELNNMIENDINIENEKQAKIGLTKELRENEKKKEKEEGEEEQKKEMKKEEEKKNEEEEEEEEEIEEEEEEENENKEKDKSKRGDKYNYEEIKSEIKDDNNEEKNNNIINENEIKNSEEIFKILFEEQFHNNLFQSKKKLKKKHKK